MALAYVGIAYRLLGRLIEGCRTKEGKEEAEERPAQIADAGSMTFISVYLNDDKENQHYD